MAQNPGMKPPSQRQLRVGEVIRQALAEVFARQDVYVPGVSLASITVAEVRLSPDLKNATVFFSALGSSDTEVLRDALDEQAPELRRQIGKKVYLRHTPRLHFKVDESFDVAGRVHAILRSPKVIRDLEAAADGEE
jgi:ribosome-binding factor A